MQTTQTQFVKQKLERLRGQWKRVSVETKVPYKTIKNIMQGTTKDPRASTIDTLAAYLKGGV